MNETEESESALLVGFRFVWITGVIGILAFTIFCLFADRFWLADLAINFSLQVSVISIVWVLVGCFQKRLKWLLALAVLTAFNLWPLLEYLPTANASPTGAEQTLKLISVNVLSSNKEYGPTLEFLRQESPDVIVILELNAAWAKALDSISHLYPHRKVVPRIDNFGMGIYSRLPTHGFEVKEVDDFEIPTISSTLRTPFGDVDLVAVHPLPPLEKGFFEHRNRVLLDAAASVQDSRSAIVVGDFNMTPWSPWFDKVKATGGLVDASAKRSLMPTWYAGPTWMGGLKIDHVLTSPELNCVRFDVAPYLGSDHRAVIVELDSAEAE